MKFKKGDKVRSKMTGWIGTVGSVPGMKVYDLNGFADASKGFVLGDSCWNYQENWELVKSSGDPMKKAKWAVKYDRDEDPVEFFSTKSKAEKKISRREMEGQKTYCLQISQRKMKKPRIKESEFKKIRAALDVLGEKRGAKSTVAKIFGRSHTTVGTMAKARTFSDYKKAIRRTPPTKQESGETQLDRIELMLKKITGWIEECK